ncbi:UNVERIFIED_CONTAM: putative LRR receptor-like serine/threonine-protein kinase [Sesamum radiatum]|uniref:non-specific serine/threonine protein kinase n=1 Tax=Sesamum radiatum TaxID=300843 RepID=A0AAW2M5G8_SESRA
MAKLSMISPSMIFVFLFHFVTSPAKCSNNETDLQALLALKNAIDDDPMGVFNSWNGTLHFCSWKGILCSKRHQNRVVSIDLMSQGLVGTLSPHLGNLSFLRSIVLQNNSFHGLIPEEIGRLRRLEWIEFSNNSFGGEIPRNLSNCKNLYYLNLIDNNLRGIIIPEIGSLDKLEALGLTRNSLSGTIPSFIGNLTSLVLLSLAVCGFHGQIPESLVQLQRLQWLSLDENRLTGGIPSGLYNISSINNFSLRSNLLRGTIPPDIGLTLPNLRFLDLGDNHFTGMIPTSLSNCSSLERINLSSNNFSGEIIKDFEKLSALDYLIVSSNHLEGDISFITSMINCTSLEALSVFDNLLTGSLSDSIGNLSSHLSFLSVAQNQLHGRIPPSIGDLLGLTRIDFSYNDLEGPIPFSIDNFYGDIPQSLGNCSNLLALDLSSNNLNGSIPPEIMSLSSISIAFNLSNNFFTGSIPSEVGSLRNLVNLDLSHNRLSGSIPNSLSGCVMLERLHLDSNGLNGEIPDRLRSLRGLQDLDLSQNNISGPIPRFLSELLLVNLNLSFNRLKGEVPTVGVFQNESAISLEGNSGLCGGIVHLKLPPCPSTNSKKKQFPTIWKILIPSLSAGVICLILSACFYVIIYRRRTSQRIQFSDPAIGAEVLRLSYADLLKATGGFSEANLLGAGRFGSVYKGVLRDEQTLVAVKVLNLSIKGASKSFLSECNALRGIRHRNLLKILSICPSTDFQGNDFKALVYEFMANGSLEKWLHQIPEAENRNLRTTQRLNIAIDIASALEYLHFGTDSTIVHGDLKPSNILLDENMTAHLGDFGLAKVVSGIVSRHESSSLAIRGTIGYIPPEYGMSDMISESGDVYSYGIFLLEMFTNRRPTDDEFSGHSGLHDCVSRALPSHVMEVLDPFILDEHKHTMTSRIKNCMVSILGIGVACSKELPRDRMSMPDVVAELHKIKSAYMTQ